MSDVSTDAVESECESNTDNDLNWFVGMARGSRDGRSDLDLDAAFEALVADSIMDSSA